MPLQRPGQVHWQHRHPITNGVITEQTPRVWLGVAGLSDVKYDYAVDGRSYHGERYVHYYAPLDSFLRIGSPILVWYDATQPTVSYAVNRPWRVAVIVAAFIPLTIGLVVILFALRQ